MEELINFIIELANFLKFGQWANTRRSFEKRLEKALLLEGESECSLKKIATGQLSNLIIKGNGVPSFAYFEARKKGWYKIYILNENMGFYCRLKDQIIENLNPNHNYYVKIG